MNFGFEYIKSITDNFSEARKVGSGGYGDVYRGKHDGKDIAVKRLHPLQGLDDQEFHNEFRNLAKIDHPNIIQLIGYCYESQHKYDEDHQGIEVFAKTVERVLCFEYMHSGSLQTYIGESKLFFKQATSWRPAAASDLMISVSSELSLRNPSLGARVPQLPVQILTLEATNMTSENLTLNVLAPEASGSSSVVSLNSAPTTPNGSFDGVHESAKRSGLGKHGIGFRRLNSVLATSPKEGDNGGNRMSNASGCTHLWLQSAVPLGCVPPRSSTTVKLELLPLTDGIITLDTLQITAREKGLAYIPEHSLEIHATSGMSSGRS